VKTYFSAFSGQPRHGRYTSSSDFFARQPLHASAMFKPSQPAT
jgi:hypothetical protein